MPAAALSISPVRWADEFGPADPNVSLPGPLFASAIRSASVLTGGDERTTSTVGEVATMLRIEKSFSLL